jgi:hypothetical protein
MLDGVRAGLDHADTLQVGTTHLDLQAYLRHAAGVTRAGVHGDISSRLTNSLSAFAAADVGLLRMRGETTIEARAMVGLRGTLRR